MRAVARDLFMLDAQYLDDLFVARALSLSGYILLVYELFDTLPDEITHVWPTRWSIVKVIYLANRYGNLVFLAISNLQLLGIWRSEARSFCYNSSLALSLIQFASFASIHILVLLRAWATWGRHAKVLAVLVCLFVIYAAVSISIITWGVVSIGYDGYPLAHAVGTCIGYIPDQAWILWIPSLVLECAIFVLTMISIRQFSLRLHLSRQSSIVWVICRDGIAYFMITLFSSLFNIFVWAYDADRPLNMLANTFTLCLMVIAGQRLVLDLRKVSGDDSLSTTRVGREIERAIEALLDPNSPPVPRPRTVSRPRSPSPIVFTECVPMPTSSGLPHERRVSQIDNGELLTWIEDDGNDPKITEACVIELSNMPVDRDGVGRPAGQRADAV